MKVLFCGLGLGGGQRNLKDFLKVAGDGHDLTAVRGDKRRPLAGDGAAGSGGEDVCAHYGIREMADLTTALGDKPDAAIVSFPARRRAETVAACLASGVPVFVEPPVGLSFDVARKLSAAKSDGPVTVVGYPLRYDRGLAYVKHAMGTNLIGDVLHASVVRGEHHPMSTDDVVFGESQEIDYLNWIFGLPKAVGAFSASRPGRGAGAEGVAVASLRYEGGEGEFFAQVALNHFQNSGFRGMRVQGTAGNLAWDFDANRVEVRIDKGRTIRQFGKRSLESLYVAQMNHFIECVQQGKPSRCSLAEGLDCLSVVDAIRTAMRDRREVTLAA